MRSRIVVVSFLLAALGIWLLKPVLAATDETALCALIKATFDPKKIDGKWVLKVLTPAQLEAFAESAQALGAGDGIKSCPGGFSVSYRIRSDQNPENPGTPPEGVGDDPEHPYETTADIGLAIAGDSTTAEQNGGDANVVNNANGGAAIAVAGSGGPSGLSNGGNASADCQNEDSPGGYNGGGSAVAQGGAGGDPPNNGDRGGSGGDATADSQQNSSSELPNPATGEGYETQTGTDDGFHGGGGTAASGPNAAGGSWGSTGTNGGQVANA